MNSLLRNLLLRARRKTKKKKIMVRMMRMGMLRGKSRRGRGMRKSPKQMKTRKCVVDQLRETQERKRKSNRKRKNQEKERGVARGRRVKLHRLLGRRRRLVEVEVEGRGRVLVELVRSRFLRGRNEYGLGWAGLGWVGLDGGRWWREGVSCIDTTRHGAQMQCLVWYGMVLSCCAVSVSRFGGPDIEFSLYLYLCLLPFRVGAEYGCGFCTSK
jgi:hypothetical protein